MEGNPCFSDLAKPSSWTSIGKMQGQPRQPPKKVVISISLWFPWSFSPTQLHSFLCTAKPRKEVALLSMWQNCFQNTKIKSLPAASYLVAFASSRKRKRRVECTHTLVPGRRWWHHSIWKGGALWLCTLDWLRPLGGTLAEVVKTGE